MIIETSTAKLILENVPSILHYNGYLTDGDGRHIGTVAEGVFTEFGKKKKEFSRFLTPKEEEMFLVHKNHSKLIKKLAKEADADNSLPEGAVIFPEDNFIIVAPRGGNSKQRANILKRMLEGSKGFEIDADSIVLKKWDEYYIVPTINVATLPEPILQWAVVPNSKKLKYAWMFEGFEAACDKLEELHFMETGKQKKADKAA